MALNQLVEMGVKGSVITYFQENILSHIRSEINMFTQVVTAKQVVPVYLPHYLEDLVTQALKTSSVLTPDA